MEHSFSVDLASRLGIEKAVILKHVHFWILKASLDQRPEHYHDEKYWCYFSARAIVEWLPYFRASSAARWLNEMVQDGWLHRGSFNRMGYDRTLWYALGPKWYEWAKCIAEIKIPIHNPPNDKGKKNHGSKHSSTRAKEFGEVVRDF